MVPGTVSRFGGESVPAIRSQSRSHKSGEIESALPDQIAPEKLRTIHSSEVRGLYAPQFEMIHAIQNLPAKPYSRVWHKIIGGRDVEFLLVLRVEPTEVLAKAGVESAASQLLDEISRSSRLKQ
jgi:hypothetical protein